MAALAVFELSGCYALRQTVGQARILLLRRPIPQVLHDPSVPAEHRHCLRLVLRARRFGVQHLGLAGEDLYQSYYDTGGGPAVWNVSASARDRFEARTWWFPVVGTVPYLGFFDQSEAASTADALKAEGLDVLLREVGAYSTLGWFDDPVFSSGLYADEYTQARVVLHEIAHATVFFPGEVSWNENFATLVGDEGAIRYLAARHGASSQQVRDARARLAEEDRFDALMLEVVRELEALYRSDLTSEDKVRRREKVFRRGKDRLGPLLAGFSHADRSRWLEREWNNALLLSFHRYHGGLGDLRALLEGRFGGDLAAFVAHLRTLDRPP